MMRAQYPGICDRCDRPFGKNDPVVMRNDSPIHPHCAPGAEDGPGPTPRRPRRRRATRRGVAR